MGFFIVGIPAVWWLELPGVQTLGVVSLVVGVAFLGVGVWRFFHHQSGDRSTTGLDPRMLASSARAGHYLHPG